MKYKNYYKTLGINKSASIDEIKVAYRKLAAIHHPDRNPGDHLAEDKFKEINEAKEVLTDPRKKKLYDRFGADWERFRESGKDENFDWTRYVNWKGGEKGSKLGDFFSGSAGDFFEMLFGEPFKVKQEKKAPQNRTKEIEIKGTKAEVEITLEEAYRGTSRQILLNGKRIRLNIKPGTQNGQVLKISGNFVPSTNGNQGNDLYIMLKVARHPQFKYKGHDLYCNLIIDLYTAVLGGKAGIKTFKGMIQIDIPKETENGKLMRLKGMGMPFYNDQDKVGDLYARISVQIPKNLSKREIDLFSQLKAIRYA